MTAPCRVEFVVFTAPSVLTVSISGKTVTLAGGQFRPMGVAPLSGEVTYHDCRLVSGDTPA
jgi:hypothetical protein